MFTAIFPLPWFWLVSDLIFQEGIGSRFQVCYEIDFFGLFCFEVFIWKSHLEEISVETFDEEENCENGVEDTSDIGKSVDNFKITSFVCNRFTTHLDF